MSAPLPPDIDDMPLPGLPGVDENETRQAQIVGWAVAMLVLSFLAVVFRFVSRWLVKNKLQLDDWLALASLPFAWMMCLISIYGVAHDHFGLHIGRSTFGSLRHYLVGLWVFDMVYGFAITLSKLSIMALWWRIFEVRSCHVVLGVLAGAEICWLVAVTLVTVFSCVPVSGFWDLTIRSRCISQSQFWVGSAVPNIAFDIVLLVLPNFYIARLSISTSQKLAVSFIFMLGTFVTICSGLRLWQLIVYNSMVETDLPWATSTTAIWSFVEGNLSVVCCCLPSMRPLLRLLVHGRVQTTGRAAAAYYGDSNNTGSLRSPGLSRVFSKRGSRGNSMMPMKRLSTNAGGAGAAAARRKTEWWEKTDISRDGSSSGGEHDRQQRGGRSGGNALEISPIDDNSWPLPSSNQPPSFGAAAAAAAVHADEKDVAGGQQPLSPTGSEAKGQHHSRQSSRNRTMAWPGWIDNLQKPASTTHTWLQLDDTPADGVTPAESTRGESRGSAAVAGGNAMKDLEAGNDRYFLEHPKAVASPTSPTSRTNLSLMANRAMAATARTARTTSSGHDGDVSELTSSSPSDGFRDGATMDDVSIDGIDERHEFHAV